MKKKMKKQLWLQEIIKKEVTIITRTEMSESGDAGWGSKINRSQGMLRYWVQQAWQSGHSLLFVALDSETL